MVIDFLYELLWLPIDLVRKGYVLATRELGRDSVLAQHADGHEIHLDLHEYRYS